MLFHIQAYISLQKDIVELLKQSMPDYDSEDLWEFEGKVNVWRLSAHGEHLSCISETGIEVEIPLYTESLTGIDAGHFVQYLNSVGISNGGFQEIVMELENLENNGVLVCTRINCMAPLWQVVAQA